MSEANSRGAQRSVTSRSTPGLAARQRALVAALVAGGPVPSGLDPVRFAAAERALRAKRAATVAVDWPLLAAGLGDSFGDRFTAWARARPPHGALRDGWDFARVLHAAGELPELGHTELAAREARWRYDGVSAPRPRWLPAVRRGRDGLVFGVPGLGVRPLRNPFGRR